MAPAVRNAVQQLHVASLRSKLLSASWLSHFPPDFSRGHATVEGYASKDAVADSHAIPKPRKGSQADVQDRPPPPEASESKFALVCSDKVVV